MDNFFRDFKNYFVLSILLFVSLIFVSQSENPQIKNLRIFVFSISSSINEFLYDLVDSNYQNNELAETQKLNAELNLKINLLREVAIENYELKSMLNFKSEANKDLILAKSISQTLNHNSGNLIINRGEADGIQVGLPVIDEDGLIGIIHEVGTNFSSVRSLNNSKLKISVTDQRTLVNGIMEWTGDKLVMKNIPTTDDIKIGDRIITSNFSSLFPPSIPIGVVVKKETNISGLLTNIEVAPYSKFKRRKYVFIVMINLQEKQLLNE